MAEFKHYGCPVSAGVQEFKSFGDGYAEYSCASREEGEPLPTLLRKY